MNYITIAREDKAKANEHWMPISSLCNPCQIKYDYIGYLDEMSTEFRYILSRAIGKQLPADVEIGGTPAFIKGRDINLLKNVTKNVLDKVGKYYKDDIGMFSRDNI